MVRIEQLASDDFLLVRGEDRAERVVELLASMKASRILVRWRLEGRTLYCVFAPTDLLDRCRGKTDVDLQAALDLRESEAVPVLDAEEPAETSPDVCVIERDGEVIGLYDADLPVNTVKSGLRHGAADTDEQAALRHVHADFPKTVAIGQTVSLLVSVRLASGGGTELPVLTAEGPIDLVVFPERGFELAGSRDGELRVSELDESLPIQFKLRAVASGPGRVKVFCFQRGSPLGAVTVHATVLAESGPAWTAQVSAPLGPPPAADADLMVLIREWPGADGNCLEYTLKAANPDVGLYFKRFYSDPLRTNPQQFFQQFFSGLDQMLIGTPAEVADAELKLGMRGSALFEKLIPGDLRLMLWKLRDRIKYVQILSDEPWIPWELLKLSGPDGQGVLETGPFLCQAFRLTRWFPEIPRRPRLRLRRLALVAPADSRLTHSVQERQDVLNLAVPDCREVTRVSARYQPLLRELQQGRYDGWHFVGHGTFEPSDPDESPLLLEGGDCLRASDISGVVRNCGRTEPLVFVNACQSGQAALSLTGMGGWARRFVGAGAAVFVGSLWSVADEPAQKFAAAFYQHLTAGQTIADAAWLARSVAGLTGLAYTVFADPFATLQPPGV